MSSERYKGQFFESFEGLTDSRQEGKVWHRLIDTLFIVTSGIICGYDEWDLIYQWSKAEETQKWLKRYIGLPNGVPSLSTLKRCMGVIEPEAFEARFIAWMKAMLELPDKDVIAVDGKTVRGSADEGKEQKALHMVSALCHSHGLVIGQIKTDEKSNEITAIPELLDQLFIEGCIVTMDAMGLQKKIVKKIVKDNKADYVINLKGNQETLQREVQGYFEERRKSGTMTPERGHSEKEGRRIQMVSTLDKGHGRIEKRTYWYATDLDWMVDAKREWEKLTGIGMVLREVEYVAEAGRKTSEIAYYVGSVADVADFAKAARGHWGVESMHWSLDVVMGEDQNQTHEAVAVRNLATIRRMVFNTLQQETQIHPKLSKPKKRVVAATDPMYRDVLINLNFKAR